MGTNYTPVNISSGFNTTDSLNQNFTDIKTALSRLLNVHGDSTTGTNALQTDLDMNSNRVINASDGVYNSDLVTVRQLNNLISENSSGFIASVIETQLGSQASGSNVFTFSTIEYTLGTNSLAVFEEGIRLRKGTDYNETSPTSITLTYNPVDGDVFDFVTNQGVASIGSDASLVSYTPSGSGAVATSVQDKLREFVSVKDFGAVGDGTNDDTLAIQSAIDYLETTTYGGTVYLPSGKYKITSALEISSQEISIRGVGADSSIISCLSCNGINFISASYDGGASYFEDFQLTTHAGSAANYAAIQSILPPGGVSGTDSRDGLHFNRLKFYDWNQCFIISDTWEWTIHHCKAQKVRQFVELGNWAYVGRITENFVVCAGGDTHGGTADAYAIDTAGTNIEGLQIVGNQLYGFTRAINLENGLYVVIDRNDMSGGQYVIYVQTVSNMCSITNNYCELTANSAKGIYAPGLGSVPSSLIEARNNNFIQGAAYTGTVGIQINDSGNQNQDNWRIINNKFTAMTSYDILVYNGNDVTIDGNRSTSTGVTNSIYVTEIAGGKVLVGNNKGAVASTGGTQFGTVSGTFTPKFRDDAVGNVAAGGTTAVGHYTKQGNVCTVYVSLTSIDTTGLTAANYAWITDLPFSLKTGTRAITSVWLDNVTLVSLAPNLILEGTAAARIWPNVSGGAGAPLLVSAFTSTTANIRFSITFLTA